MTHGPVTRFVGRPPLKTKARGGGAGVGARATGFQWTQTHAAVDVHEADRRQSGVREGHGLEAEPEVM